jgi:hypothetical protein
VKLMNRFGLLLLAVTSVLHLCISPIASQVYFDSLVPNLCPRACNMESYAHDYLQGQVLFRFDNGIANTGDSALLLLSGPIFGHSKAES